jgi:hypothetical protein
MRRAATIASALLASAGFYMLLIDTASLPELYAGAAVVAMSAVTLVAVRERGFPSLDIRVRWLLRSWRAIVRIPAHVAIVSLEAFVQLGDRRRRRGAIRNVRFAGGEDPADHGRSALAVLFGSVAPNTVVLGVDPRAGRLIVHQLRQTGGREELDVLGLG